MPSRTIEYPLANVVLTLELVEGVFEPTTTTQMLAAHFGNVRGKAVLDLGCGAGAIGIAAAKLGAAKVLCVDVMAAACEVARRNAERNAVNGTVEVRNGDLFAPVGTDCFDVIVDDVSGIAHEVARVSHWYPPTIPTGGPDGTVPTTRMLRAARKHLRPGGFLLFPVIGLATATKILDAAREVFGHKLAKLESKLIPFSKELYEHIDMLSDLKAKGVIDFEQRRSRYLWDLSVYRADV